VFEAFGLMFLLADTPVHAGAGRELGGVDLPLQRERRTGYPIIQGSGLKGMLRATAQARAAEAGLGEAEVEEMFGPDTERASEHAGALAVGDARLLLFPTRSLVGVFAWITCPDVLARFVRDATITGFSVPWAVPAEPGEGEALVSGQAVQVNGRVVLEEFTFAARQVPQVQEIARWLSAEALPVGAAYQYWRDALSQRLVILRSDVFRDFTTFATEVVTRIRLNTQTKTVAQGALWSEENLPADSLLYAPLMATRGRRRPAGSNGQGGSGSNAGARPATGSEILQRLQKLNLTHVQVGGNETVGRGIMSVRLQVR